jgi:hypothetical protein
VLETGELHTGFKWSRPDGKKQLGSPRRIRENDIKVDLQEV